MASTASEAGIKRNYPVTSGLDANQKHEGRQINLVPEEESLVPERRRVGI